MIQWETIKEYQEILFQFHEAGIAKISINRPHVHNAFTPLTVKEMIDAMNICRDDERIGVIILTGEGGRAFVVVATSLCVDMADTSVQMLYLA
jgi:naphthoate synthase